MKIFIILLIISLFFIINSQSTVFLNKNKALGVVTNSEGIRDKDLEYINQMQKPEIVKKWLKIIAKDQQEIILHSNDKEWIKANGKEKVIKYFCYLKILTKNNIKPQQKIDKFILDTEERNAFNHEYELNYHNLNIGLSYPKPEEFKICEKF